MIASDTKTNPSTADTVLAGLLKRGELAEQLGCGERTVIRRERQGMPVIIIGATRLYDPQRVREWILAHERAHDAPKRGRPAKRVVA